ncbi:MAG: hypothetical protein IT445_17910 [Phycisphaeraceae bacterium]|nr:hypothetical protein [Phycisphaeraceae bacterium]
MRNHLLLALSMAVLTVLVPACQSQQQTRPKQEPYEKLSPLQNNDDPFAGADQPSLQGLDRSHWPQMTFSPADAGLSALPAYFGHVPLGDDAISPLLPPAIQMQIAEATSGQRAGNWNGDNARDAVTAPFHAAVDVALLPVK